jgi:hypothetical protein
MLHGIEKTAVEQMVKELFVTAAELIAKGSRQFELNDFVERGVSNDRTYTTIRVVFNSEVPVAK